MKTKTEKILAALRILAWLGMVGYAINFGSQVVCLVVSFSNPAASRKIPGIDQNLINLLQYNFRFYVLAMYFAITLSAMFVYLWYQVIMLLSNLNIKDPFTFQVSGKLDKVARWLFAIWIVGFIGEKCIDWLAKDMGEPLHVITVGNEFLFTAGIVYIVSQIFKRGVEIQEENQQTI